MAPWLSVTLKVAAPVVAGTMVGNELAVAVFFHPGIRQLDDATHTRAAQALARVLGAIMPFWYALTLLLSLAVAFALRPMHGTAWWLALAAAGLFAVVIVFTVVGPVPINNRIARWRLDDLPADWRQDRRRWDRLHEIRVAVLGVALILLTTACVV